MSLRLRSSCLEPAVQDSSGRPGAFSCWQTAARWDEKAPLCMHAVPANSWSSQGTWRGACCCGRHSRAKTESGKPHLRKTEGKRDVLQGQNMSGNVAAAGCTRRLLPLGAPPGTPGRQCESHLAGRPVDGEGRAASGLHCSRILAPAY